MEGKRAGCEVRGCTEVEGGGLFRVSKTGGGAGVEIVGKEREGEGGGGAREGFLRGFSGTSTTL
jgi:hypothetical protein